MSAASKALTLAHRRDQARRAARIAAIVALYYREKVDLEKPETLARWLALMVPRLLEQHEASAQRGAAYANRFRQLDIDTSTPFEFEPIISANAEQIENSLRFLGVKQYLDKARTVETLDISPVARKAMLREAKETASVTVMGASLRHVQNGARNTIEVGIDKDPVALGYVRVTRARPCFFCAMLASRGLEGGVYAVDSFDRSDPRFVGDGTAKVHDNCQCHLQAVYRIDDEVLADNKRFEAMWYEFSGDGDADPLTNFRRHYEGRTTTNAA